jgi:ribosomal protein L19
LQKHKIKIIENMKMQTENFFGILISTRIDRIEKVFGYKKPTCNIKNT